MSFPSLKNVLKPIIDFFLGKPCDSGLGHRWSPLNIITGDTYCRHPDCVSLRDQHRFETVDFGNGAIRGPKEAVKQLKINNGKMYELAVENNSLMERLNNALAQGRKEGIEMERARLYNTLLTSRQLLLDQLNPMGINEFRVRQFIDWFENTRDARLNPSTDAATYKICKNIVELEETLLEVQKQDVQLT